MDYLKLNQESWRGPFVMTGYEVKEVGSSMTRFYLLFTFIWCLSVAGSIRAADLGGLLGCMGGYVFVMWVTALLDKPTMWEITYKVKPNEAHPNDAWQNPPIVHEE